MKRKHFLVADSLTLLLASWIVRFHCGLMLSEHRRLHCSGQSGLSDALEITGRAKPSLRHCELAPSAERSGTFAGRRNLLAQPDR